MASLVKRGRMDLLGPIHAFTRHRSLTAELSRREILGRYRGAGLGLLWSLITPFLMLMVYTIAFGFVLRSRWPHSNGSTADYALILFLGLIVHGFFADCVNRAPSLVVANVNLVKRIVFPLHILPWPVIISALFHAAMNLVVFMVLLLVFQHHLPWTVLFVPVVMIPLVILTSGVSWVFAALGVYMRDIGQLTGVITTAMLFLSSAIVPLSVLPPGYRVLFKLNPLTFIIDQVRAVAIWGKQPDLLGLAAYCVVAMGVAFLGYAGFCKASRGFGDVL